MCMAAYGQASVLPFVTHASFFSAETHQNPILDPQVFVAEPSATAGVGPQGIKHVVGVRNARPSDPPTLPILNAAGKPLGMSLGAWLDANGEAVLTPQANGQEKVTVILSDLKPGGRYSLFENHFDQKPVGFTPLDGTGEANSFVADASGKAVVTTIAPAPLTHDNAVLVVYHSDGRSYGKSRGDIGVNAHHQLIARP
ncbi:hypothetical protein EPN42_15630 [bacterium]|nr:MAG: hypothetical protein EPN42_15630 [bacterium]